VERFELAIKARDTRRCTAAELRQTLRCPLTTPQSVCRFRPPSILQRDGNTQ
jgi:hypothetical protein